MLSVGLTGGIACGKSRVLEGFARKGLRTLDLDRLAHRLMEPGAVAYDAVLRAFGRGIIDAEGRIDRGRLGSIVFADAAQRARLDAIVHPLVREEEGRLRRAAGPDDVFVTDGALLVEAGFHLRFDRLIVVHARPEVQLARLRRRARLDENSARQRIDAQMGTADKRRFAHFEIDTSGHLAETDLAANQLADRLLGLARTRRRGVEMPWRRTAAFLSHGPTQGPAGLRPAECLAEMMAAEGPDPQQLAEAAVGQGGGAWYEAAADGEPGPETLAGATALLAVARAGADREFVAGACYTMGRVTHTGASRLASACLFGLGLAAAADGGLEDGHMQDLVALAERWGGAGPEPRVVAAVTAAARHPGRVSAARELAGQLGGDPTLAAGIAGFGAGEGEWASEVEEVARALQAYASSTW